MSSSVLSSSPTSLHAPEPVPKKATRKAKDKRKINVHVDEHGKNERTDPNWAYNHQTELSCRRIQTAGNSIGTH
ncbi:hypothetical protein ARMGADRAFT_1016719 [Armillaria gallica]|uniref:Uncharacterized protein n=1 Tax=Armillaria gallica TaxID=47427 RepID=A0A2H3D9Q3_ARMGA|nr:hypothetical protein ARMGADRAFT_1016719 [Armillaria gallica]